MTEKELNEKCIKIDAMVNETAEKCGLSDETIRPIRDGIADKKGYLECGLKVAWVLKEPYDDWNDNGKPKGGGGSLVDDYFRTENAWKNPVWQKVAYVMHGFRNNLLWEDMDFIRNHHDMINEILTAAWINVCKMPGHIISNNVRIENEFRKHWRRVVLRQLDDYEPDVVIFGNTFGCFRNDPEENKYKAAVPDEKFSSELTEKGGRRTEYFRCGAQRVIAAYHPGRKGGNYVNALICALKKAQEELNKK